MNRTASGQESDHGSPDLAGATLAGRGQFPREGGKIGADGVLPPPGVWCGRGRLCADPRCFLPKLAAGRRVRAGGAFWGGVMEITIRHVIEISPSLVSLLERIAPALDGRQEERSSTLAPSREPGPAPAAETGTPPQVLPRQNAPAAVEAARRRAPNGKYRTPERLEILKRDWPAGRYVHDIIAEMNALPGEPVPDQTRLVQWAGQYHLKRPEGWDRKKAAAVGREAQRAERKRQPHDTATWAQAMAWAETIDPDLVLRGTPEERLAQINDLRKVEGLRPFTLEGERAPQSRPAGIHPGWAAA